MISWYIARATGVVALVLLTLTVTLGLANAARLHGKQIPRFAINGIHRNASLLAVCFVALHVLTTIADGYVAIPLLSTIVPFSSAYKPLWVGLGAVSVDLLLAVLITSLLRRRIGKRAWRATHWLAYASWPVAVVHSVGIGSDAGSGWMRALAGACVAGVLSMLVIRAQAGSRRRRATGTGGHSEPKPLQPRPARLSYSSTPR